MKKLTLFLFFTTLGLFGLSSCKECEVEEVLVHLRFFDGATEVYPEFVEVFTILDSTKKVLSFTNGFPLNPHDTISTFIF